MQDWDAIVIGAGPAGMAAAATLAENGARSIIIDEQPEPGGQIYRAIERNMASPMSGEILGKDYFAGAPLTLRLRRSGATMGFSTNAWRIDETGEVWTKSVCGVEHLQAKRIVLATGAMERPVPVDGWTLPGVMTIGALQILLKSSGLVPDKQIALAGSGPLFYLFAMQCLNAGVRQMTLLDTGSAQNLWPALPHLPRAVCGEGRHYLIKGVHMLAALHRSGVRTYRGVHDLRIEGEGRAEAVSFATGRRRHRIACRLVGLHEGVIPHQQAARSIGCAHEWDEVQRCFRPVHDDWGRSSKRNIYIAGDAGGIVGARASAHDGAIAALAILAEIGRITNARRDELFRVEERARRAHLSVRPFLDRLYPPPDALLVPPDPVTICRCESVRADEVRKVAAKGCPGPNQAKAFLRCGMGPCQGRLCGPTVAAIMARETFRSIEKTGYYRIRPPLKPVTVGELAGQSEVDRQGDDTHGG